MRANYPLAAIVLLSLLISAAQANGLQVASPPQKPWSGDTPDMAGPIATDLSPAFTPKAIAKAMRKVGDWELVEAPRISARIGHLRRSIGGIWQRPDLCMIADT